MRYLHILEIKSLSVALFSNIFAQSRGCLCFWFAVEKLTSLFRSHLFIFAFIFIALGNWSKKALLCFMSENMLPVFSSRSFKGSCLKFKSFSHFYFNSVNGERECTNFIDLHAPWPSLTSKMIFWYSFEYQKITVDLKTQKLNCFFFFFVLLIFTFFIESMRWCMEVTRPT